MAEQRLENRLEALRAHIEKGVEKEIGELGKGIEELKTRAHDQLVAAGVGVGKAAAFLLSFGPTYQIARNFLEEAVADFKSTEGADSKAFFEGYGQGSKQEVQSINMAKSHYNMLKRIKIYKQEKDQYIDKLLYRSLRKYKS